jgi:DNA-binding transcriptional ArsR family regulator
MSHVLVFGPDDSARVRFALSPLWEAFSALRVLTEPRRRSYHLPWLESVRPKLARVEVELLLALSPRVGWTPDFLTPVPTGPGTTVAEQLDRVRATPPDLAERDISRSFTQRGDQPVPAAARLLLERPEAAPRLLADALEVCWELLVAPHWPRLRDLLEADIQYRTGRLGDYGLERTLTDLHPRVRWNERSLIVQSNDTDRRRLDGAGLVLLPSAFVWPDIVTVMEAPAQPTLIYPARGIAELWQPTVTTRSDTLARLLGATRASLLQSLAEPASTMTLARRHALSPGTVSEHLSVLHGAGLITRLRQRHTVFYRLSALGTDLTSGGTLRDTRAFWAAVTGQRGL